MGSQLHDDEYCDATPWRSSSLLKSDRKDLKLETYKTVDRVPGAGISGLYPFDSRGVSISFDNDSGLTVTEC